MENCSECDDAQISSKPVSQTAGERPRDKISSSERSGRIDIPIKFRFREDGIVNIFDDGEEI